MRANLDESFVVFTFKDSSSLPFFLFFLFIKDNGSPLCIFFFYARCYRMKNEQNSHSTYTLSYALLCLNPFDSISFFLFPKKTDKGAKQWQKRRCIVLVMRLCWMWILKGKTNRKDLILILNILNGTEHKWSTSLHICMKGNRFHAA